jgi:hypothetical protein
MMSSTIFSRRSFSIYSAGLLACLFINLTGCHLLDQGLPGSGVIKSENRALDGFQEMSYGGSGQLDIEIGPDYLVDVTADDNLLEFIVTEVVDGNLKIYFSRSVSPTEDVKIKIKTPDLKALSLAGSADAEVDGLNETDFNLKIAGSGSVKTTGSAEKFTVNIAGSGDVASEALVAREVVIKIAGSGDVRTHAVESLSVSIAGSGSVEYLGSPKISQSIAGSGDISAMKPTSPAEKEQ